MAALTIQRCSRTMAAGVPAVPTSEPSEAASAVRTNSRTRGHLMRDSASGNCIRFAIQRWRTSEKSLVYQGIAQPLIQSVGEKSAMPSTLSGWFAAR